MSQSRRNKKTIKLYLLINLVSLACLVNSHHVFADEQITEFVQYAGFAAALTAAVSLHPEIKGKTAEVEVKKYTLSSARASRYPTLTAQANSLDEEGEHGNLTLKQPLWAFGRIDNAVKQAKASFKGEHWALLQVQRQVIEETAVAYARILGIRQQQQVAHDNVFEHDKLYQRIKRRSDGQMASTADVNLAYSRLIQAQAREQRLVGELLTAATELQSLTQVVIDTTPSIDRSLSELPELQAVEVLAVENSADIHYLRDQQEVARLDIKQEQAASLPTLYFQVEHEFLDQVNEARDRTRSGLVIEASIGGAGFSSYGRVKSAQAKLNVAQYDIDSSLNNIKRRVQTLMSNRKIQQDIRTSQIEAISVVEETMASFVRQYETGRKSWIDVLNTQRELTELRYQLEQINNEWLVLSLRLAALIGQLDQVAGISSKID